MPYTHVKGGHFTHSGQVTMLEDGVPMTSLVGWVGAAQVQDLMGNLVEELEFTWLDASQRLMSIISDTDTSGWPVGTLKLYLSFTSGAGQKVMSLPSPFIVVAGFHA